ncbi:hypothetical protein Hanom_Chr02g00131991 [Helianthus anomalus]
MKKNQICIFKIFFLIRYIYTNTNIGLLTKLFLRFRLVINLFGIRFRPLVSQIPNFVKALGAHFFELEYGTRILRAGPDNTTKSPYNVFK